MCSKYIMAGVYLMLLKINNVDVSHMPHDEAVRMFLNASDPIIIEVCRKRNTHCKQYRNNEDDNIADNYRHDSETATARPALELHHATESGSQLLANLVLFQQNCETTTAPTAATTPTTYRKRVNSASSTANCSKSTQKQQTELASAAKNLTLFFPPPPPLQLPANDLQVSDTEQEDSRTTNNSATTIAATNEDSSSSKAANSKSSNARLQPPPAPSLQPGVEDEPNSDPNSNTGLQDFDFNPKLISTAIQTDVDNFVHSLFHVGNAATTEDIIEQEHNLFEACLAPEIDIEEITLRKSDSNEHLGLTVCYSMSGSSSGNNIAYVPTTDVAPASEENETCSEVYISDIQPDSIAGRDGRLRQGDQILQVNGKDVTNKKETETLIAENNNAVTLLVSRYLYADEDDFNDTCVAGLHVEEEDEDDDDDDDGEYYEENNLAYENCFISANDCETSIDAQVNEVFMAAATTKTQFTTPTSTLTTAAASPVASQEASKPDEIPNKTPSSLSTVASPKKPATNTNHKSKSSNRSHLLLKYDPLNHLSIKAHLQQVNQELEMFDCRVENMMLKPGPPVATASNAIDYDTEHIYETIPEDSESEPFYCSPYESSTGYVGPLVMVNKSTCTPVESAHLQHQKQRVAAWLGMHVPQRQHSANTRSKSGTMRCVASAATAGATGTMGTTGSSSSGGCGNVCQNEHENSSSAYNTGGSNNSGTALTLVINSSQGRNLEQTEVDQMSGLRISKSHRLLTSKEKLTSPKHQNMVTSTRPAGSAATVGSTQQAATGGVQQQVSTSTMYTNVANLQQTMQLQQKLFRQALTQQQQNHYLYMQQQKQMATPPLQNQQQNLHMQTCPQFTAPNLSQYHFVSSQEVSVEQIRVAAAAAAAKASNEEHMVWKVKRRQDGTRYIVRRPARTRMMRDRALRINAERENHEITTTEDDTISEIKTGRYWTRDERKKHIERARERRQQQQQQLATAVTMRIGDKEAVIKCQAQSSKEKLLQSSIQSNPAPMSGQTLNASKAQRQVSAKIQHHQLQFSSATTNSPISSKQFSQPMAAIPSGTTMVNNVADGPVTSTDAVAVDAASTTIADNTALNINVPATANNVTVCAATATPTGATVVGAKPQPPTLQPATNGNKMAGLLSVTTV